MNTFSLATVPSSMPRWLWAVSIFGILWNVFGVYQYVGTFTPAGQAAMTAGMTAAQAALYLSLPSWISAVFAIGVFGGLAGSVALARRHRVSRPLLAASLVGYILLFAGDAYHGVFAALPSQLAVLAVVVIISVGMLWTAHLANERGLLR